MKITNIIRVLSLIAVLPIASHAITLLEFDFAGSSNTAAFNSQNSTFNVAGVASSIMSRGAGISANNAGNSFRGTGFSNDGISLANTDYFEFTVAAVSGSTITIDSIYGNFNGTTTFSATPGVTMAYAYSLDGGSSFVLMSSFAQLGSGAQSYSIVGTDLAALTNVTSATFRLFASGQTTTGGWGLQSAATPGTLGLSVSGSVSPIPEPSSYAIMLSVLAATSVVLRRGRRNALGVIA